MGEVRRGATVRIFLKDGTPDGIRVASKSNWTGTAVAGSRTQLPDMLSMSELEGPGVYVLVGADGEETGEPRVYIGESDQVRHRVKSHEASKSFWRHMIVFTSHDTFFNRVHAQHLESRLIQIAKKASRAVLENTQMPGGPHISDADREDAETFLDNMLLIFPLLGVHVFEVPGENAPQGRRLHLTGPDARAEGRDTADGFLVYAGALARKDLVPSAGRTLMRVRDELLDSSIMVEKDGQLALTQDHLFNSPSLAAGVILGRRANGWTEWRDDSGRDMHEIEQAELRESGEAS